MQGTHIIQIGKSQQRYGQAINLNMNKFFGEESHNDSDTDPHKTYCGYQGAKWNSQGGPSVHQHKQLQQFSRLG